MLNATASEILLDTNVCMYVCMYVGRISQQLELTCEKRAPALKK